MGTMAIRAHSLAGASGAYKHGSSSIVLDQSSIPVGGTWARHEVRRIFALCGIAINGPAPADVHVHDNRFYQAILSRHSLGLGESYMDGWWDCRALDVFFQKIMTHKKAVQRFSWSSAALQLSYLLINLPRTRAFQVGREHYDIGNALYEAMLGGSMAYSCGYWAVAKDLDAAQEAKFDLICRKLSLHPGQKILDIGCGWGSFARYAAMHYGVSVVGITVSRQQEILAREICAGLPVEIVYQDYHKLTGTFDHIVSVGMFEHVGVKNYRDYMKIVGSCLSSKGLFLLHTIGSQASGINADPWISKYIFPHAMIPSLAQISKSAERVFVVEDVHNFGSDYDKTLMAWHDNFEKNWPRLRGEYSVRFYRLWRYYLLLCAGLFRSRNNQVWQIVLSKHGVAGGYQPVR